MHKTDGNRRHFLATAITSCESSDQLSVSLSASAAFTHSLSLKLTICRFRKQGWQRSPMATTAKQKGGPPQIYKLDKALKLAEQWVDNMTKTEEKETIDREPESRPSRLGLGAKVSRQTKFRPSDDPVERKLHARLESGQRNAAKRVEDTTPSAKDDDDNDDHDSESRSSAFAKRRAGPQLPSFQATKKQK